MRYLCKGEEWDEGAWIEADSMHQVAEFYAKRWEGEPLLRQDLYEHYITVEVTEESGQRWLVDVKIMPVYEFFACNRRKLEDA